MEQQGIVEQVLTLNGSIISVQIDDIHIQIAFEGFGYPPNTQILVPAVAKRLGGILIKAAEIVGDKDD